MKISQSVYLVGSGEYGISHEYDCNVYAIKGQKEVVLIDTGSGVDTNEILENVRDDSLSVKDLSTILLTHSHADHACGSRYLFEETQCEVFISEEEKPMLEVFDEEISGLKIAKKSGLYGPEYSYTVFDKSKVVKDVLRTFEFTFTCLPFSGHSRQSILYLVDVPEGRAIFTGDVVFAGGVISLLNCGGSSLEAYRENISKLHGLVVDCMFPGHGTFCLKNGQKHLDQAIKNLDEIYVPKVQCVK